jgi:ribosomal protein L37E
LQRPRFLALSEFGPRSLVYHEGRAYRVVRAMLSLSQRENATADSKLPTKSVRICKACGAGHFNEQASLCHSCGADLGDAENVKDTYRIENVATQPAERITANDEERQRQGFELQTTFEWAVREHVVDVRRGAAVDEAGEVARLIYGSGATITRLNKGLRRRADRTRFGFKIDPVYGYWARNDDEEEPEDPTASPRQWIVPCVRDHKNALLLQPLAPDLTRPLARLQPASTGTRFARSSVAASTAWISIPWRLSCAESACGWKQWSQAGHSRFSIHTSSGAMPCWARHPS